MMNEFDYGLMQPVSGTDPAAIRRAVETSGFPSCEYAFANLLLWSGVFHTRCAVFRGRMYFHFPAPDDLLFPCGGEFLPPPGELRQVSEGMKRAGFSGVFSHAPEAMLNTPGLADLFTVQPMDRGSAEYIYKADVLAELRGAKFAKKRNLIAQFERQHGPYTVRAAATGDFRAIKELSECWVREHGDDPGIERERLALAAALARFQELGLEGLLLMTADGLKAYAVFSRINADSCTVHFEKALPGCKGASQVINRAAAIHLRGRYAWINREQDLNLPGLRRAKMSYRPDHLLSGSLLIPQ